MKKLWTSLILCLMMSFSLLGLVACGQEQIPIESITFEQPSVEVFVGGSKQLNYEILPSNARGFALEWTSSNPKIASVNGRGKVYAYTSYGEVTITVKDKYSGVSASCNVIINDGKVYKISPNVAGMKTQYFEGETFDPTGLIVNATYESGVERQLLESEYTLSYPDVLTENTSVVIKYGEITSYINITVIEDYITGIAVINNPIKTSYYVGETFNPSGMKVALVYASGKTREIQAFSYDTSPLMYGDENVKISYEEYSTYFTVNIRANSIINNISKLQSTINSAEVGSSIMISNGTFNISTPILIPKSKNLTIFGESQDVIISSSAGTVFKLVNDVNDEISYNTTIANMTLKSSNSENSIISLDNETSNNNLNNFKLTLFKLNFEISSNANAINLSAKTDGFETSYLNNVNVILKETNIYYNETTETSSSPVISFIGINNSQIDIIDSNFVSKNQLLYIENSSEIKLNIENSFIESDMGTLNFTNVEGGEINISNQSIINGNPAVNMINCSNLDFTITDSNLTIYSQEEIGSEVNYSIFTLTGCQNINLNILNTNLNILKLENYENYYVVILQDGTMNSANNNITFTNCNFNTLNQNKFLNLEKEPSSAINEVTTEE